MCSQAAPPAERPTPDGKGRDDKSWKGRARFRQVLKIIATIILLGAVLAMLDLKKLAGAMVGIDPIWLLVSIGASVVFVLLRIVKWTLLTRSNGVRAPFAAIARMMLMALTLGIVTPGRVGEVVAVAPFPPEQRAKAVMLYLYDRIGELCTVLLFSIPAALVFLGALGWVLSVGIVVGCGTGVALLEWRGLRMKVGELTRLNQFRMINSVISAEARARPSYWAVSVVTYAFAYGLVAALIVGVESGITWRGLFILPVVTLSNLVSITVGGLGVREGLAAAMAPLSQMHSETAAAAFFLSFVFTRVVAGVIGLAWVALRRAPAAAG